MPPTYGGQAQKPKCGISQILDLETLFGRANAHELFLGLSLITKAKRVFGNGVDEVRSARWICKRMAVRCMKISDVRSGAIVRMYS